jgi:phosphate:Na+ symporter
MSRILFFILLGYFLLIYEEFQVIIAGIAIFTIGIFFIEDGLKKYIGFILEKSVEKSRRKILKSFLGGMLSSMIIQSSLLINMILLTFLSTRTVSLVQAYSVIVGASIGTTFSVWIVLFTLENIPLIAFVIVLLIGGLGLRFFKTESHTSIGNMLIGTAFLFLGIDYMSGGFQVLESNFDLVNIINANFFIQNIKYEHEIIMFIVGAIVTILIQSSSATISLVLIAIYNQNLILDDAILISIGIIFGRTIVMIFGTITVSNRYISQLSLFYFIYVGISIIVSLFLYSFYNKIVLTEIFNYSDSVKLALFYTAVPIIASIFILPFLEKISKAFLVRFKTNKSYDEVLYLETNLFKIPATILASVKKEEKRFYNNVLTFVGHSLLIDKDNFFKYGHTKEQIEKLNEVSKSIKDDEFEDFYQNAILDFSKKIDSFILEAHKYVKSKDSHRLNDIQKANNDLLKVLKDLYRIHPHIVAFCKSENQYVKSEYDFMREETVFIIYKLFENKKNNVSYLETVTELEVLRENAKKIDIISTGRLDELIRNNYISTDMATALINDSINLYTFLMGMIDFYYALWVEDDIVREKLSTIQEEE